MNVFVLGGTGFIGRHIVLGLLKNKHKVSVGCRNIPENIFQGVTYYHVDLLTGKGLDEALVGVDVVVHCASATVPASSAADPVFDIEANLIGTLKLLSVMKSRGIKRIIYLSSGGTVYGEPRVHPVPETHSLNPISTYGIVKTAVESYLHIASREWGLNRVVFRPSNPYGEGQISKSGQGLIAAVIDCAIKKQPVKVFGDGSMVRDYIYVKDLADLIVKSVSMKVTGIFNAGSGIGFTVNNVIDTVESVTGTRIERNFIDKRAFDVNKIVLDIDKTCNTFSWSPVTDLSCGIARQYAWLKGILNV